MTAVNDIHITLSRELFSPISLLHSYWKSSTVIHQGTQRRGRSLERDKGQLKMTSIITRLGDNMLENILAYLCTISLFFSCLRIDGVYVTYIHCLNTH